MAKESALEKALKQYKDATPQSIRSEAETHATTLQGLIGNLVLEQYNRQKGNEKFENPIALQEEFAKDDYVLKEEFADVVAHKIVAYALKGAFTQSTEKGAEKSPAQRYEDLINKYMKEKKPDKKAELYKEMQMYYSMARNVGIDVDALESAKVEGFTPSSLNSIIQNLSRGLLVHNSSSRLKHYVSAEDAEKSLEELEKLYGINPAVLRAMGPDAMRQAVGFHKEADGDKKVYKQYASKKWYAKK